MEIRFNVTGAERKALVSAISELTGWAAVFKFAPTFSYVVNNYTIDKFGTLSFDESVSAEDAGTLIAGLEAQGYVSEDAIDFGNLADNGIAAQIPDETATVGGVECAEAQGETLTFADTALDGELAEESPADESPANEYAEQTPENAHADDYPDKLVIEIPLEGFTETAFENLEKLVASKAVLIKKAIGGDNLSIIKTEETLQFPWFGYNGSAECVDAYTRFVAALCAMAKTQKRVLLRPLDAHPVKEKQPDEHFSEKFAFRCFLLRLGFIGDEYKTARRVLLSKLSGNGSFKNGGHKKRDVPEAVTVANSGDEETGAIIVRESENSAENAAASGENTVLKCGECWQHCYYTDGLLRTKAGDIIDTSKRTPSTYTHYCLGVSSGYRKIKHATDWSGFETPPTWCPLCAALNKVSENCGAVDMNNGFPSQETVKRVRQAYPQGCRVELVAMNDSYTKMLPGEQGLVEFVDDTGTIFVVWDSGSRLGVVYGVDYIKRIDNETPETDNRCGDCLACSNSMSEPAEGNEKFDKLFCVIKQDYVNENGYCCDFN